MAYKDMDKARINWRKAKLKSRWNLSLEEFQALLDAQDGVCAICKQPENPAYKRRLAIDHDHITGNIRGLLCHMCNTGLGKFGDNPELLIAASNYLKEQQ
jgi:hypothetical protein